LEFRNVDFCGGRKTKRRSRGEERRGEERRLRRDADVLVYSILKY
jgi:hypothetical protein